MATKNTPSKNSKASASNAEPNSMADLLASYGSKTVGLQKGDKIRARVAEITPKKVVLDIGGKSEGIVAEKAYDEAKDFIRDLEIGSEVDATVIVPETRDGFSILSLRHAAANAAWDKIGKAQKEGRAVVAYGHNFNSAGIIADVEGLPGFVPTSQLGKEAARNPQNLIGKHFRAKVIELSREQNKVVLSEREVSEAADIKLANAAYEQIAEGEVYEGKVTTLADFGAFVEVPVKLEKEVVKLEGLVHVSELSWDKVDRVENVISEGDVVKVRVIGKKDRKLSLSVKQAQADPWDTAETKYKKEGKTKGVVIRSSDFGTFIQLEPGIEGLVHVTKIPPGTKLEAGQEVNVYIEEIDAKARKLSLGLVLTAKPVGYR